MLYRFRAPLHIASTLRSLCDACGLPRIGTFFHDQATMLRIVNHKARSRVNIPEVPVSRPFYVFLLRFGLWKWIQVVATTFPSPDHHSEAGASCAI